MALTRITGTVIKDGGLDNADLPDSGVTAGSYGASAAVPVVTVNSKGIITGVTTTAVAGVSNVTYNSTTGVLTIDTSDGSSYTTDLSIGSADTLSLTGLTVTNTITGEISSIANHDTDDLSEGASNLYYTDARVSSYLTTNSYATSSDISTAISNLIDSAPGALDTLNELAAAIGDDANFATTVTNSLATKVDKINITGATVGSGTAIPVITYNAQGQITSATTTAVTIGTGVLTVNSGTGLSGSGTFNANATTNNTITLSLANTAVTAGTYGSASAVPVITIDAQGRITSASTTAVAGVSSTSYNASTGVLTINTSDGGSYTSDLGVGTADSPTFAGITSTSKHSISYASTSTVYGNHAVALDIKNTNATPNNYGYIVFRTSTNQSAGDIAMKYTNHTSGYGDMQFSVRGASGYVNPLTVAQTNRVGIGTSNPQGTLDVNGNIVVSGTVDGRDLSADGTKLDGIESGATADQTASEILTLLKNVDGAGSGLDADLLDGIDSSRIIYGDNSTGTTSITETQANGALKSGFYNPDLVSVTGTNQNFMIHSSYDGIGNLAGMDLLSGDYRNGHLYFRNATGGGKGSWHKIWHSGVDGAGSGLDADTLDGLQASQFLRSDADDQTTNVLAVGSASGAINGEKLRVTDSGTFIASFQRTDGTPHLLFKGTGGTSGYTGRFYMDNGAFQMSQGDASGAQSGNVWLHGLTNGNVGIGTSTPEAKLHVAGQILAGSGAGTNLVLDDGAESAKWGLATGSYNLRFQKNNGSGTYETKVTLTSSGGITTTGSVDINGSYLKLPTASSAPSNPTAGYMYTNTGDGYTYVYDGSDWRPINSPPLGTLQNPATSAQAIIQAGDATGDGFYYITIGGTVRQVWCDMTNDGGGWMMAARVHTSTDRWYYSDAYWTNSTLLNETQPYDYGGHIKTWVYTQYPFSQVRFAGNTLSNGLVEPTWTNATSFASFMGSGTNSSNSRTTWDTFVATAIGTGTGLQANCNQIGTNKSYNYMWVKIGITANNEGDCNTNDSAIGFGIDGISPYGNTNPFGAFSSSGQNYNRVGWIFLK